MSRTRNWRAVDAHFRHAGPMKDCREVRGGAKNDHKDLMAEALDELGDGCHGAASAALVRAIRMWPRRLSDDETGGTFTEIAAVIFIILTLPFWLSCAGCVVAYVAAV